MTKMDQLPPSISEACMDEMSFIVYSLPVYELINSDLLGAFQKKGVSNVYIMIAYIWINQVGKYWIWSYDIYATFKEGRKLYFATVY